MRNYWFARILCNWHLDGFIVVFSKFIAPAHHFQLDLECNMRRLISQHLFLFETLVTRLQVIYAFFFGGWLLTFYAGFEYYIKEETLIITCYWFFKWLHAHWLVFTKLLFWIGGILILMGQIASAIQPLDTIGAICHHYIFCTSTMEGLIRFGGAIPAFLVATQNFLHNFNNCYNSKILPVTYNNSHQVFEGFKTEQDCSRMSTSMICERSFNTKTRKIYCCIYCNNFQLSGWIKTYPSGLTSLLYDVDWLF